MNYFSINFNNCLEKFFRCFPICRAKWYFSVEKDVVVKKSLNIVQQVFRSMGFYASTHSDRVIKQLIPLTFIPGGIPAEYTNAIIDWFHKNELKHAISIKKPIDINGQMVEVSQWIKYPNFQRYGLELDLCEISWFFESIDMKIFLELLNLEREDAEIIFRLGTKDPEGLQGIQKECYEWVLQNVTDILNSIQREIGFKKNNSQIAVTIAAFDFQPIPQKLCEDLKVSFTEVQQLPFGRRTIHLHRSMRSWAADKAWRESAQKAANISWAFALGLPSTVLPKNTKSSRNF